MKILITGGTGYLGSHLVHQIYKSGNKIACVVENQENLGRLENLKKEIKVIPVESMSSEIPKFSPEVVIHTACVYSREGISEQDVFKGNLLFPLEVLQIARASGVKKWINTATSLPSMISSYALAKSQFVQWGRFYAENGAITFVNLQLEHFYGKDAPTSNFLSWVIGKLKKNEPLDLTIGTQRRDFVFIDDVLHVYDAVLNRDFEEDYIEIPVGTGEAPSVREVVEYLKELIGSESELHFGAVPMRREEPDSHCDIKMLQNIGVQPLVKWKTGLKIILE